MVSEDGAKENVVEKDNNQISLMSTPFMLGFFFFPEDGKSSFLQNFCNCLRGYIVSHLGR
jgi:hypothetical protein